jgi:hypothetical protein
MALPALVGRPVIAALLALPAVLMTPLVVIGLAAYQLLSTPAPRRLPWDRRTFDEASSRLGEDLGRDGAN